MNITKLMSSDVVTVTMDDTVATIKDIFDNTHFHHLLVTDNSTLAGVISDRDILRIISPRLGTAAETTRDSHCLSLKAHKIMSRELVYLTQNDTVEDAVNIFNVHKISCIPVVNESHAPIGIVSWRDIIKAVAQNYKKKLARQ